MERESNIKHFIAGIFKFGGRILHRQHIAASEPLTVPVGLVPHDKETILRLGYRSLLKEKLQNFGITDGIVTIEDITTLLQAMTAFPEADRFMGYAFSQLTGDLQTTLLTTSEARSATAQWLSGVHEELIDSHQNFERETEEWEEKLGETDVEFRSLTAEVGRQIKATENAIKLLGGDQDLLPNLQT